MTQDLIDQLRGLLAKGVPETDSGWYISDYTPSGLSLIGDGLCSGIFPIACEGPQAALIVATVNALSGLLDTIEAYARRIEALEEALEQAAADFEDIAQLALKRIDDGEDLGARVWRIALQDIAKEADDDRLDASAALHIRDGE